MKLSPTINSCPNFPCLTQNELTIYLKMEISTFPVIYLSVDISIFDTGNDNTEITLTIK